MRSFKCVFSLLLFLAALQVFAEDKREQIADAAAGDLTKAFDQVASSVEKLTLANGLRIVVAHRGEAPVFRGMVAVRVGGADEPEGQTGISHMLEHMAFKGTPEIGSKDYPRERKLLAELEAIAAQSQGANAFSSAQAGRWQAINDELNKIWVGNALVGEYQRRGGASINASTDIELTKYEVDLPRSALDFWCWVESERIKHPVYRQFYQERDVVLEEKRMRLEDSPENQLNDLLVATAFTAHPYRRPVIGYDWDIRHLTASMLAEHHDRFYVPNNIVVTLVGDVDLKRDRPTLERYFGSLPKRRAPAPSNVVEPNQEGERRVTLYGPAQPILLIGYRKPVYPDPDDTAITVAMELMVGSRVAPLYRELVLRRQLVSSLSYFEQPGYAFPNLMMLEFGTKGLHSNQEVLAGFDEALRQFQEKGVTDAELSRAKRSMAVDYLEHVHSNGELADLLATSEQIYGDYKSLFKTYREIMAVRPEDIQRVVKQYLNPRNRTVGFLETER